MKGHYKKRGCTCDIDDCNCNKTWSFIIDIGRNPKNGRRKQATKAGYKTKEEAELAAAALLNEMKQGTYIKETNTLFMDFAEKWLSIYTERTGPKPGTIRNRRYCINRLLPYFAHLKLRVITDEMYQSALKDLKNQGLSKSTLEGIHVTGKMIFGMAQNKRMLKSNPTEFAYIPKDNSFVIESDEDVDEELLGEDELPKYFEKEQLAHFLDTVKDKGLYMDELIFTTLAYTGMRVGELVVLKWKDIDFNLHTISITKTYSNEKNNTKDYQLVLPKTIKSKRKILVDEVVIELLKKHKLEQEKLKVRFGKSYRDKSYIFSNFNLHPGYPIAEVDIEEIMDRLGHSDEKTTRKVYLHVTNVMKREASDKFGKLMRGIR